jgi:DNA sulfur modification protein DndD
MIIDHLSIENFGPFDGPNAMELAPANDGKRSIVLIGADNGGGKTTLLAALKLCLYGKRATDLWEGGQQGYRQFISEKFNNLAFERGERQMILEIGLRVWEQKIPINLVVRRSYQLTDNRLFLTDNQEMLEILRNGRPWEHPFPDAFDEDDANQYDDLLRLLIPSHLAQFYFFDGERVRELFRKATAENISQAIRDLLGLTLFERLAEDLRDYRRITVPRLYGKHQDKQAALLESKGERDRLNADIRRLEGNIAEADEDLAELQAKIEAKESEFRRLGGMQQTEVDQIREQEKQCKLEYDRLASELKTAIADHMSQAFLLSMRAAWEDRMGKEGARRQWLARRDAIEPYVKRLVDRLVGPEALKPEPPLTRGQSSFLAERIEKEVKGLFHPPPAEASNEFWLDLRQEEIDRIKSLFDRAQSFSAGRLRDIIDSKERVSSQRRRLAEKLQSLGDTESTRAIAEEIRGLLQERGAVAQRKGDFEADLSHCKGKLSEVERQITNLEQECGKSGKGQEKSDLSARIEQAIKTYVAQAKIQKADAIERHLNQLFMAMANCRDEVRELKIDRATYEIQIIDNGGKRRAIETGLSAGQAQVLAMAFVGALAKASGKILPRIIDTPLGRLDVNHRRDVTRHFFVENSSPQTILLSTPTEINNCIYDSQPLRLLDDLRPYIARVWTLEKVAAGRTMVRSHYFGNKI